MAYCDIKNLLFDLGGVIMNLKRENCIKAFEALGMAEANAVFGEYSQQGAFLALEEGALSEDDFHAEVKKMLKPGTTDDEIDNAFCEFLVGIPLNRLKALESLHKDYKIYLLSNTNSIHIEKKIKEYFCLDGKNMEYYFDDLILSYEAKAAKPKREIFEYTVKRLGIKPEETMFFDDSRKNLESASQLGFNTALVDAGVEFMDYFIDNKLIKINELD